MNAKFHDKCIIAKARYYAIDKDTFEFEFVLDEAQAVEDDQTRNQMLANVAEAVRICGEFEYIQKRILPMMDKESAYYAVVVDKIAACA